MINKNTRVTLFVVIMLFGCIAAKKTLADYYKDWDQNSFFLSSLLSFDSTDDQILADMESHLNDLWIYHPDYDHWYWFLYDILTLNVYNTMAGNIERSYEVKHIAAKFVNTITSLKNPTDETIRAQSTKSLEKAVAELMDLYKFEALQTLVQREKLDQEMFSDKHFKDFISAVQDNLLKDRYISFIINEDVNEFVKKIEVELGNYAHLIPYYQQHYEALRLKVNNANKYYKVLLYKVISEVKPRMLQGYYSVDAMSARINLLIDLFIDSNPTKDSSVIVDELVEYAKNILILEEESKTDYSLPAETERDINKFYWNVISHMIEKLKKAQLYGAALSIASHYLTLLVDPTEKIPLRSKNFIQLMTRYCENNEHFYEMKHPEEFNEYPVYFSLLYTNCYLYMDLTHITQNHIVNLLNNLYNFNYLSNTYFTALRQIDYMLENNEIVEINNNPGLFKTFMIRKLDFISSQAHENLNSAQIPKNFNDYLAYYLYTPSVEDNVNTYILSLINYEFNGRSFQFYEQPSDENLVASISSEMNTPKYKNLNKILESKEGIKIKNPFTAAQNDLASNVKNISSNLFNNLLAKVQNNKNDLSESQIDENSPKGNTKPNGTRQLKRMNQGQGASDSSSSQKPQRLLKPIAKQQEKDSKSSPFFSLFSCFSKKRLLI